MDMSEIDTETRLLLGRYGFDAATFTILRERLARGLAELEHNREQERLEPPRAGDLTTLPPTNDAARARLQTRGLAALADGQVAVVVLAGGMATRFGGVVKAAVQVLPGHSFLDLKLRDFAQVAARAGRPLHVGLMTSFATDTQIARLAASFGEPSLQVETFPQLISLRLQANGELFRDRHGKPSPYAPGHGDLVPALRRAGLLTRWRNAGVRSLYMSNVDNLAATLDPAVIGAHLEDQAAISFEVAPLAPGDKGGVPARVHGRLQVIEALRYPRGFVEQSIPWLSTNSLVLDLAELDRDFELSWFRVDKQVDGRPAVQFERLVNQLTAFLPAHALAIEREGLGSRFLPVKDPAELSARLPLIRAVLEQRGVL